MNPEKLKELKKEANSLPCTPGVYLMKDKEKNIIYIGKAKALKNRVTQYFGSGNNHSLKVLKMVDNIDSFDYILCDTEYEALLLENTLIKQHKPKYNILLKDDKGYHFIKISSDKWRKIEAVHSKDDKTAEYIGPYYSYFVARQAVDEAIKVFKLPNCNRNFDKKSKPCLNYHIGICSAPCNGGINIEEYNECLNSAVSFIKKGTSDEADLTKLKEKMQTASDNLDFEYAARLRDRIRALQKSKERQKVISSTYSRLDVFAMALSRELASVVVFIFNEGHLSDKREYFIERTASKEELYSEFLRRYYQDSTDIPPRILIDLQIADKELIEKWLSDMRGSLVKINLPQKGKGRELVDMCISNSAESLSKRLERSGRETTSLNELSNLLGLSHAPERIESYDVSNTAGSENVASMVVFLNGRAQKSHYRRFKIKSFIGQDDFRSLGEVLTRRFNEYKKGEDESFKQLPDLILLDGGLAQVTAVRKILSDFSLEIPLFGMVKDSKHKTRAITSGGGDIEIKANRKAYTLVTAIQDEVHRFAIDYHHKRNKMTTLTSELLSIDGVGPATAKKLILKFKTIGSIRSATVDELKNKGFSEKIAQNVFNFYKK